MQSVLKRHDSTCVSLGKLQATALDRRRLEVLTLRSTKGCVSLDIWCRTVHHWNIKHALAAMATWKLFDIESDGVWIHVTTDSEKTRPTVLYSHTSSVCHIILFISHLDLCSVRSYAPPIAIRLFFFTWQMNNKYYDINYYCIYLGMSILYNRY